jgi:DNA-binding LytR/AlgR family response regulator
MRFGSHPCRRRQPLAQRGHQRGAEGWGLRRSSCGKRRRGDQVLETRNDIRSIFTDIDLPGSMDGLKLAAAVRDRWPPVHIIVTTGMRAPHRDEMPANSIFIAKPYRSTEVLEAVRSFENALP